MNENNSIKSTGLDELMLVVNRLDILLPVVEFGFLPI